MKRQTDGQIDRWSSTKIGEQIDRRLFGQKDGQMDGYMTDNRYTDSCMNRQTCAVVWTNRLTVGDLHFAIFSITILKSTNLTSLTSLSGPQSDS